MILVAQPAVTVERQLSAGKADARRHSTRLWRSFGSGQSKQQSSKQAEDSVLFGSEFPHRRRRDWRRHPTPMLRWLALLLAYVPDGAAVENPGQAVASLLTGLVELPPQAAADHQERGFQSLPLSLSRLPSRQYVIAHRLPNDGPANRAEFRGFLLSAS